VQQEEERAKELSRLKKLWEGGGAPTAGGPVRVKKSAERKHKGIGRTVKQSERWGLAFGLQREGGVFLVNGQGKNYAKKGVRQLTIWGGF